MHLILIVAAVLLIGILIAFLIAFLAFVFEDRTPL